jgi:cell division protein ZapA
MSIGENGICVRILEKEFRVACSESQELALRDAAQYLDKQMRLIRQSGRVIGLERIAVMAALNITNELLTLKKTAFEPECIMLPQMFQKKKACKQEAAHEQCMKW